MLTSRSRKTISSLSPFKLDFYQSSSKNSIMTRSNSSSSSSEGEQPSVDVANKQAASPEVLPTDETSRSPSEGSQRGRARPTRPKLTSRKSSGPIVVPRNHIHTEEEIEYPPDDARAMSPRRNSQETEAMEEATRSAVRQYAYPSLFLPSKPSLLHGATNTNIH